MACCLQAPDGARAGRQSLDAATTYTVTATPAGRLQLRGANASVGAGSSTALTITGPGPLAVPGKGTYRGGPAVNQP